MRPQCALTTEKVQIHVPNEHRTLRPYQVASPMPRAQHDCADYAYGVAEVHDGVWTTHCCAYSGMMRGVAASVIAPPSQKKVIVFLVLCWFYSLKIGEAG